MGTQLFRAEAVATQERPSMGVVRLATPISQTYWTLCACTIAAFVIAWMFTGHYTRREHVAGSLVPSGGVIAVRNQRGGVISQVMVKEGDRVHRGDPLMLVSGERNGAALGSTETSITEQIHRQIDGIEHEIVETKLLASQQLDGQNQQLSSLRRQLADLDGQVTIEERQASSYEQVLAKIKPLLAKGFVSALQIQDEEARLLQARADERGLIRQREQVTAQISDVSNQITQLPLHTSTKVNELSQAKEKLGSSLAENEADRAVLVLSPVEGEVSSLLAREGASVTTGQRLLSLLPAGSTLDAELLVPSLSIGFIRPGTSVSLHYQSFPYEKFGVQKGVVTHVSSAALTPDEVTEVMGTKPPDEAMYRVSVKVPSQSIAAYGHAVQLKAGMAIDANILLDDRRISEWIFEPLYALSRNEPDAGNQP